MLRTFLKSKIHMIKVTSLQLFYEGSISLDPDLMEAADIRPFERVQVINFNNGNRMETYVLEGKRGSKEVCLNGPAARMAEIGDVISILSYAVMDEREIEAYRPILVQGKEFERE